MRAHVGQLDRDWSHQYTAYLPIDEDADPSRVLEATRHVHGQLFSEPVSIDLRVPRKNQPKVFEDDEIPSERYHVLWDGRSLLVAWEQPLENSVGNSGGHIVEEILEQATNSIDAGLVVQACNPQCRYVFLHTAIRATADHAAATDWSVSSRPDDPWLMDVVVSSDDSLGHVSSIVWWHVRASLRAFADMKNRGRQILELEGVLRADLDQLNRLHHERATASQQSLGKRIKALWTYRSWRRISRYYLARLWLGLGSLERLRRRWTEDASRFRRTADEHKLRALFTTDTVGEMTLVEQLDLGLIESAVQHAEDRLSSNVLTLATLGGGVAGALVAAVLTTA